MSPLLEVRGLSVDYEVGHGLRVKSMRVVDDVDLSIMRGEIVGLVGESGCGKSTLARTIVGLSTPASGDVLLDGEALPARRPAAQRRKIQMVFQDPGSSLDPRHTVEQALLAPIRRHKMVPKGQEIARAHELLELVELPARLLGAKPSALSGGQKQRVAIARALSVKPDLLVADEAVAALDASATGAVLNLLADLRKQLGLTVVFISHDLSVVRGLCDRVVVMYLGAIVESGAAPSVFADPGHPYTRALFEAVPRMEGGVRAPMLRGDEPPSPLSIPGGCRFHPRCLRAEEVCSTDAPEVEARGNHGAACHFAWSPVTGATAPPRTSRV